MSTLSKTLMDLMKHISERPQLYAATPEAAHGLVEGMAWVVLHDLSTQPIERCMRTVRALVKTSTEEVYKSETATPLLCDETFPERVTSFEAFRTHCKKFIELLEKQNQESIHG